MLEFASRRWMLVLLGLAVLSGGCAADVQVMLKGDPQKPLSENCDFLFLEVDADRASLEYQQVGILTVQDVVPGDVSQGLKEKIRRQVCKMGGERVVPMTDQHSWSSSTASYLVLKSRGE